MGIVWILKILFQYGITPLIQHIAFSGIKIEGTWETNLGTEDYNETAVLKRFGEKVWGIITVTRSPTNADVNKQYKFKGFFKNGFSKLSL